MGILTRSSFASTASTASTETTAQPVARAKANKAKAPTAVAAPASTSPRRSPRLSTSSYKEASTRSYKIYTPTRRPHRACTHESEEDYEAAETIVSLGYDNDNNNDNDNDNDNDQQYDEQPTLIPIQSIQRRSCLNPMSPVTRYIYKLGVYSMDQTTHYNTSYVVYNRENRTYHVYSIISMFSCGGGGGADMGDENAVVSSLPEPTNPIQTKYSTYVNVNTYVMNLVIPSEQREYCVLADFVGVVGSDDDFKRRVFSQDSCYYDIDDLWNTTDSKETITGHKMFILTPTRVYYWDAGAGVVPTSSMYTVQNINSALDIIAIIQ